jgi:hypothetical protein
MGPTILTVVVVCNDDLAPHENAISDLDVVSCGNVPPTTYSNITAYDEFRSKCLIIKAKNGFHPQSMSCRKVLTHLNGTYTAQVGFCPYVNLFNTKLRRQHAVPNPVGCSFHKMLP